MKKLTTRGEVNFYYEKINKLIDEIIESRKVMPKDINKWFKKNWLEFLRENDLNGIEEIKTILNDVLDHRKFMEKDGVLKFESFIIKENLDFNNLGLPDISHQKVIADVFLTSLGHIEIIDENLRIFSIEDFGKKKYCLVLNDSEINMIKDIITEKLTKVINKRILKIKDIENISLSEVIEIPLMNIVDDSKIETLLSNLKIDIDDIIINYIQSHENLPDNLKSRKLDVFKKISGWTIFKFKKDFM